MYKRKRILEFEYTKLPEDVKECIMEWYGFHNDIVLPIRSEFQPGTKKETWANQLTMKNIQQYYKEQVTDNGYKDSFNTFIKDHGLQFDLWLVNKKINLKDVEEIYINICW